MNEQKDREFMLRAIELAKLAAAEGEVPVGAVIVDSKTGEVVSEAYNRRERGKNAIAHAEILAIQSACKERDGWRLCNCTLYVTLEPCPMCAGAIVNSRIDRVVFGAEDMLAGCCGSVIDFNSYPFNHSFSVTRGICADECNRLLSDFFVKRRREGDRPDKKFE